MLYCEQAPRDKGGLRVYSTTDDEKELDRFRCLVRAPRRALHLKANKADRVHLILYGAPKATTEAMLPANLRFATPIERATWERSQPDIVVLYPSPWIAS